MTRAVRQAGVNSIQRSFEGAKASSPDKFIGGEDACVSAVYVGNFGLPVDYNGDVKRHIVA
ncbi:MAG: hypothetical protein BJ554DRAFT_6740 [Olpidium bornovanus]|uniref:Uncharacterized protein n=1 Tax=Olpidium bornovanus TaxID=278681 RepID=A0A8H8A1X0_9FUNG|nr:MAG: hypothetical protein BJ554DRAFT_6740 [Olpidium bornovanus]